MGQQTSSMTIQQAVENAVRNYPAILVSQEHIEAASAGIQLARTAYLPRVDTLAQVSRATRNNVFGLLLPQSVIPPISGPVLGTNSIDSVWGSAVGATASWEPFDLGTRRAVADAASAAKTRVEAALERTRLEVSILAADAYLTLLAAQETERAVQAGVERAQVLVRAVRAQADAQLRPGADASRAEAELAVSQAQLARAQQAVEVARTTVAQFTGMESSQIRVVSARLLELPPEQNPAAANLPLHPLLVEQNALVEQKKADLQVLTKSYAPRFSAQASMFARGSGAQTDGSRLGGMNGLGPDTKNFAVGFSVTFALLDLPSLRARQTVQQATIRAEAAKSSQISTDLKARSSAAVAAMDGARKVAGYTPIQVTAANAANEQAAARYQAGLGTIVEVADAQRLLTQAQIDDVLARLGVWRAMLGVAAATGDIQPFLRVSQ
jgi:outer membrane protein TolC